MWRAVSPTKVPTLDPIKYTSSYLLFVAVAVSVWMPLFVVGLMAAAVVVRSRYRRGRMHVHWRAFRARATGAVTFERASGNRAVGSVRARYRRRGTIPTGSSDQDIPNTTRYYVCETSNTNTTPASCGDDTSLPEIETIA